ncbi:uncharacterized protein C17orf113-like [Ylistrum balloti]|uniref:uncharacterized protein C17orf113-like n=1 Tax=Ylistrum balloti TaxID=509963 RepID=UPI00290582FA|nr:uncharacterized protein C17orf113-like [Ylistrum balloti]
MSTKQSSQLKLTSFIEVSSPRCTDQPQNESVLAENETNTSQTSTSIDETKRSRVFNKEWQRTYPWLIYDENESKSGVMKCDTCIRAGKKSNPFVNGCTNFQKSTIVRHEQSVVHTDALRAIELSKHFKKSADTAKERSEKVHTDVKTKRHVVQLRTVYIMAKNNIAANNFSNLMELQQLNECRFADDYYTKPEIINEMETAIAAEIENSLFDRIKGSPYYGVMLDETCDISVEKKLALYINFVDHGKKVVAFVGNRRVQDCTAEGIKTALLNFLHDKGLVGADENYTKFMGLGTDGAAVMVGCRNGVAVKIKELNHSLVSVHCVAHRLNLAASQASKGVEYAEEYKRRINMLYHFYSDSSVKYDKLRELQELLHGQVCQVPEGTSVRWLSVENAVKMIFKYYDSIVMSLEDDKDKTGEAKGLWGFIATCLFILMTALLIDVLSVVGTLSLIFQKDSVNLSAIRSNVDSTVETIRAMLNGSQCVDEVLAELGPALDGHSKYKGVHVQDNANLRTRFEAVRRNFFNNLIQNMENRFSNQDIDILECFDSIFNPRRYPVQPDLSNYANEKLDILCEQFRSEVDIVRCRRQFLQFKHFCRRYRVIKKL